MTMDKEKNYGGFNYNNDSQQLEAQVAFREDNTDPHLAEKTAATRKEKVRWKDVFYDFTQASTIHGLNHITEDTPFKVRRITWIILVIAGVCLFALQVVQSVVMYYSRPVSVNVKVNYNDTLKFPAVTICNQNSFRISQSEEHGFYDTLTKAFSRVHHQHEGESHHNDTDRTDSELHKIFAEISMADIYKKTAHAIDDMVISCTWDGRRCAPGDIVSTLTDHGSCLTFNGGTNDVKNVTRIGSSGGLRLRLNIEQYEYMSGPIEGAGIKLLLHDQQEVPMVKYLGQAIPPGAHAQVGMSILQVSNLKPPYGRCSDDKTLTYYDHYTVSACLLDCRQKYLIKMCQCRDVYMRSEIRPTENATVPICTLNQYLTCLVKHLESYASDGDECSCPIPCKQVLYSPSITHATVSKFDQRKILISNDKLRGKLEKKFHHAREVRQRADADIRAYDTKKLRRFTDATDILEKTIDDVQQLSTNLKTELDTMFATWKRNYLFHRWVALACFEFIIKHNYIRGWDIRDERTFSHMTYDPYGFWNEMIANLNELRKGRSDSEARGSYREFIAWEMEKKVALRIEVVERGVENITEVNNAFRNGIGLAGYTFLGRAEYDQQIYSPKCLETYPQIEGRGFEYLKFFEYQASSQIRALRNVGDIIENAKEEKPITASVLASSKKKFLFYTKGINYRLFLFKDRVVDYTYKMTLAVLNNFDAIISKLEELRKRIVSDLQTLGKSVSKNDWRLAANAREIARQYLNDTSVKKSDLAKAISSENLDTFVEDLRKLVAEIRARSRSLQDNVGELKTAAFRMYQSLMSDSCSATLYQRLRNDTDRIRANRTVYDSDWRFRRLFRTLSEKLPEGEQPSIPVDDLSADELAALTNADLPSLEEKSAELDRLFAGYRDKVDFNNVVANADVGFTSVLNELKEDLVKYTATGAIDTDFLRDNIMNLDIFVRELSYEEIEQQKAYELTNLWSDIGGSLGLFVGASVLTVAELIDIVVHTILRKHVKKKE